MDRIPVLLRVLPPLVCGLILVGCNRSSEPQVNSAEGSHGKHGQHAEHDARRTAELVIKSIPATIEPGESIDISASLRTGDGSTIKAFEPTHEKLAHLIIVRKGLDLFAHLHPELDDAGNFKTNYTFSESGTYYLFLDYKAKCELPSTARSELKVEGIPRVAEPLNKIIPGEIASDDLRAFVSQRTSGSEKILAFKISDKDNKPVDDLEPYLGAMGHLVVLSGDASKYVHAHPVPQTGESNVVEFEVHYPSPGIYKGWGQFQRNGKVHTIPVVMEVPSKR
jgi:hypothetical protein